MSSPILPTEIYILYPLLPMLQLSSNFLTKNCGNFKNHGYCNTYIKMFFICINLYPKSELTDDKVFDHDLVLNLEICSWISISPEQMPIIQICVSMNMLNSIDLYVEYPVNSRRDYYIFDFFTY